MSQEQPYYEVRAVTRSPLDVPGGGVPVARYSSYTLAAAHITRCFDQLREQLLSTGDAGSEVEVEFIVAFDDTLCSWHVFGGPLGQGAGSSRE